LGQVGGYESLVFIQKVETRENPKLCHSKAAQTQSPEWLTAYIEDR